MAKTFKQLREATRRDSSSAYTRGKKLGSSIAKGTGKLIGTAATTAVKTAVAPVKIASKTVSKVNKQIHKQAQQLSQRQRHSDYIQGVHQRQNIRHLHAVRRRQK